MSSRKNGDIRGFFKSAGSSSPQTQHQPTSPPPSIPDVLSSPRTPPRSAPRVFSRDEEIRGSDDDDPEDDSDDSLGSITKALGFRSGPANHQRDVNVLSTPQAKRIASGIHRSPLTLQPKKHRFDLKALVNHSRELKRTEESVRKADALIAQEDKDSDGSDESDPEHNQTRLEEVTSHLFNDVDDDEEGKENKLRRALKRSGGDEILSSKHCYFFDQEVNRPKPGTNAFPRNKATGPWKCLAQVDSRRRAFIMGLPHTFVSKGQILPDEIYQWILDEICTEQNAELCRQYINLAGFCRDNARRLVDSARLYSLLERIGGPTYTQERSRLRSTMEVCPGYLEQNWSPLVAFLQLLERIAPHLQRKPAISAIQLLLRISLDPVVNTVVHEHHTRAMTALVSTLARYKSQWNTACGAICSYIFDNVEEIELKAASVFSIPSSTSYLVDLRRRIAAEALFRESGLGSKPVGPQLSLQKIYGRLKEEDFTGTQKTSFDFEQLRVLTTLLDIVLDRADFVQSSPTATETELPITNTSNGNSEATSATETEPKQEIRTELEAEAEQNFNADIDALANHIKRIQDSIRDKDSRKNVKLGLLGLEKRLRYAVRTRPAPKTHIFSSEVAAGRDVDTNIPKQRDFMRHWALKKKADKEKREETEIPDNVKREDE